jgi:hypothetical protein
MNLRRDTRVAFLVEAGDRYDELRGVLVQGEADVIDSYEQVLRAGMALHERYAEPREDPEITARSLRAQAEKRCLIRVPYTRVVSWDHRKLKSG